MGQKAHPTGMRVGIVKSRISERFAKDKRQSTDFFVYDIQVRELVEKKFSMSGIAKIVIRQTDTEIEVLIFSAKVGRLVGKDGENMKKLEKELAKKFGKTFKVIVKDVKTPELSAKIMAEYITSQLEKRMPYRKVAKSTLFKVMSKGARGIKIQIAGRLNGADIARSEKFIEGRVSLQTFRNDIDYHYMQAKTKYGVLGVKVRIEKGIIPRRKKKITKKLPNIA